MKTLAGLVRGFGILVFLCASSAQAAYPGGDVALVTALEGNVARVVEGARQPMQSFVKLKEGDQLTLDKDARIQLVFFESRRQESWQGAGKLEVTLMEGRGTNLPEPQVKVLPAVLVKQISKTPTLDSQGRAGAVRLRAIPTPSALAKLDSDYKQLRAETTDRDDLNPELFLLSGLLEMRQLERIEQVLGELKTSHPDNVEAKVLASLYQKTLKNLRESGK